MTYASSSGGPGVVFSIQQGMVDRGADIGWLSQYPHEKEILFGPLTGLEVRSTRTRTLDQPTPEHAPRTAACKLF